LITSPHNEQLKTMRKLRQRRWRDKLGLFSAEGEDLVAAAERAGWPPDALLRSGVDVEPRLLDDVSSLGSGSRVIGVYPQRWSEPSGSVMAYLHAVDDPGNVGAVLRSAHALCDGPVLLGPGCADPFSPKAVRASMGSVFARPPGRGDPASLPGTPVALDARGGRPLAEACGDLAALPGPLVLCLGAEREGLPKEILSRAAETVRIPLREGGPESLNVAMAATVALYELGNRMARHA
jgi:RNA methyltransferase, TrmH family